VPSAVAANLGATLGIEAESDNVLLTPGNAGPRGLGHFRVCFAQDEAAWRSALHRIVSTVTALAEKA
jgi:aspartate/methionine/tyrosine aminotransferase